jgi:hypothetical protein
MTTSWLQLGILIAELHRSVTLMEADIQSEEKRAGIFDCSSPEYPVIGATLSRSARQSPRNDLASGIPASLAA